MIPAAFEYDRPATLDQALALLERHAGSAKVIAGGQSLLPLLKLRLASAGRLIDIGRIPGLRGVRALPGGGFAVGALTTYAELAASPATGLAALADALPTIADVQVRNRGTVGGAIAHADPAADLPAVLLALEATVVARSTSGERQIPITGFFTGSFATALRPGEIVTEIRLPAPSGDYGSAYVSLEQPASGYAIVGVAAVVGRRSGGHGPLDDVRVAITGVGEAPYRTSAVEAAFRQAGDPAAAAAHATDGVTVNSDIHAGRDYRAEMARVMTRRALEAAVRRAG